MTDRMNVEGVWKRYPGITALAGVSVTAGPGEIVGLLGSNGSGKSTLLGMIAGLTPPDAGIIRLFGDDSAPEGRGRLRRIGMLFDHSAHWEQLSGWDNAYFFARSYGVPAGDATSRLLDLFASFALDARRDDPVASYSYGMRRKLALIEALSHYPDIILLDEPSMGLDFPTRIMLQELLRSRAAGGATVLFATNDVFEAEALAGRVILLSGGRVVATGAPVELIRSLGICTTIELRLRSPIPLDPLSRIAGVEGLSVIGDTGEGFRVRMLAQDQGAGGDSPGLVAKIAAAVSASGGMLLGIECIEPNLGDVLLRASGEEGGRDS
jgi:ABC-2 type transport system ATP-binding protein